MKQNLARQYDNFADTFLQGVEQYNDLCSRVYFTKLNTNLRRMKVLDIGCGNGRDLSMLLNSGAYLYGIDASQIMVKRAKTNVSRAHITQGVMEDLPYNDGFFDVVMSKYVIQSSTDVLTCIQEMNRVLKPGGTLLYLAVHPLRQFIEKKKHPKDYFLQEIVESVFFEGTVTASEPTHTMNDYLNPQFLQNFRVIEFEEHTDYPSCEKIDGDSYPCFFVLKARKESCYHSFP